MYITDRVLHALIFAEEKDLKLFAPTNFLGAFPIFILITLPPPVISIYTGNSGNFHCSLKPL